MRTWIETPEAKIFAGDLPESHGSVFTGYDYLTWGGVQYRIHSVSHFTDRDGWFQEIQVQRED